MARSIRWMPDRDAGSNPIVTIRSGLAPDSFETFTNLLPWLRFFGLPRLLLADALIEFFLVQRCIGRRRGHGLG